MRGRFSAGLQSFQKANNGFNPLMMKRDFDYAFCEVGMEGKLRQVYFV